MNWAVEDLKSNKVNNWNIKLSKELFSSDLKEIKEVDW